MRCSILTPAGSVFAGEAEEVIVPLPDGWLGILHGHAPFISRLMRGHVVVRSGGTDRIVATIGGVLNVDRESVVILTGAAVLDRDLAALEQEHSQVIERMESLEHEAEKHFDRVYRQMARTLGPNRDRFG